MTYLNKNTTASTDLNFQAVLNPFFLIIKWWYCTAVSLAFSCSMLCAHKADAFGELHLGRGQEDSPHHLLQTNYKPILGTVQYIVLFSSFLTAAASLSLSLSSVSQ